MVKVLITPHLANFRIHAVLSRQPRDSGNRTTTPGKGQRCTSRKQPNSTGAKKETAGNMEKHVS